MRRPELLDCLAPALCPVGALPAIAAAPAAGLTFAPPVHYGLGGGPADLAAAGMNGDDRPDLVASAGNGLDILLGVGRSGLAPAPGDNARTKGD